MANLTENPTWETGIRRIETSDPVVGGVPDPVTGAGMSNIPHFQLAQRTLWLKQAIEGLAQEVVDLVSDQDIAGVKQFLAKIIAPQGMDVGLGGGQGAARLAFGSVNTGFYEAFGGIRGTVGGAARIELTASAIRAFTGVQFEGSGAGLTKLGDAAEFAKLNSASGYQRFPGGLILQWDVLLASHGSQITFPIAFPTAGRALMLTDPQPNATTNLAWLNFSTTGFTLQNALITDGSLVTNNHSINYLALGF